MRLAVKYLIAGNVDPVSIVNERNEREIFADVKRV